MFKLRDRKGVYMTAPTWHYDYKRGDDPVPEGRRRCRVALDNQGHVIPVAPKHHLTGDLHWARSIEEVRAAQAAASRTPGRAR
jgi:hypothetical protein